MALIFWGILKAVIGIRVSDKAEEIGKLAVESIKKTGEHFNLRVPLTGEYKISNNWSGTH